MAKVAFLFPGQGAQSVGMGQTFLAADTPNFQQAKTTYDVFDEVVDSGLSKICFEGPEDQLKRTLYTQPAILATSIAAYKLFKAQCNVTAVASAGHSLGEYGALYAAGAIDEQTAAQLVKQRASLMEQASSGAMSAILGNPAKGFGKQNVEAVLAEVAGTAVLANDNTAGQWVISGEPAAVEEAGIKLKEAGAKRVIPLPVGGAFHSPLMDDSAASFKTFLQDFSFNDGEFPVITNLDAKPTTAGADYQAKLSAQINNSVRWTETMAVLFTQLGVDTVIEFGPGKVLTGMVKKDYPDIAVYNVFDAESLKATVEAFSAVAV